MTLPELVGQFQTWMRAGEVDPDRVREVVADIDHTIAALTAVRVAAIASGWTTEVRGHG